MGGQCRPAGQDEAAQRASGLRVHRVNLGLKPGDLSFDHPQRRVFAGRIQMAVGGAKIGTKVKEVVGDAFQSFVQLSVGMQPRKADGGVGFIHRAIGRDAQAVLGHPSAVAKRGFALASPVLV